MPHTLSWVTAVVLVAKAASGASDPVDPAGRALEKLVETARAQHRPILIQLETVWSAQCQAVNRVWDTPEGKAALANVIVSHVDVERGDGPALVERFKPSTLPTLLVLDAEGHEQARLGFSPELPKWLAQVTALVGHSDEELAKEAAAPQLQILAARAHRRGDWQAERGWLTKLTSASDGSRELRAEAAHRLLARELGPRLVDLLRAPLVSHAKHHAGLGTSGEALLLLNQLGVDGTALDRELEPMCATVDPSTLRELVVQGLRVHAYGTALAAARRWATLAPTLTAQVLLAEVHHARGEKTDAVAVQQRILATPKLLLSQRVALERDLARFERGDRNELALWVELDEPAAGFGLLGLPSPTPQSAAGRAEAGARRLLISQAGRVGAACQTLAPPGLSEVYVRVTLGEAASRPSRVEVLEPRATAGFRRCIEGVLRATVVPPRSLATQVVTPLTLSAR